MGVTQFDSKRSRDSFETVTGIPHKDAQIIIKRLSDTSHTHSSTATNPQTHAHNKQHNMAKLQVHPLSLGVIVFGVLVWLIALGGIGAASYQCQKQEGYSVCAKTYQ